jgi:hypothetical protein
MTHLANVCIWSMVYAIDRVGSAAPVRNGEHHDAEQKHLFEPPVLTANPALRCTIRKAMPNSTASCREKPRKQANDDGWRQRLLGRSQGQLHQAGRPAFVKDDGRLLDRDDLSGARSGSPDVMTRLGGGQLASPPTHSFPIDLFSFCSHNSRECIGECMGSFKKDWKR